MAERLSKLLRRSTNRSAVPCYRRSKPNQGRQLQSKSSPVKVNQGKSSHLNSRNPQLDPQQVQHMQKSANLPAVRGPGDAEIINAVERLPFFPTDTPA